MRHRILVRAILCSTLLFGATTTRDAFAEASPADIAQARELGQQALAAFDAGNYAESEKLWISASGLFNAPTLTLGLARTQVKLGKLVAAQESYNKIIREQSQIPNLSPAFKDALDAAKAEVGPVSARIASVVIRVEGAENPSVTLDGQAVASAALGLKRPVDPGAHVVKAEAPGFKPAEASFEVADAGSAEANLRLEKDVVEVATTPAPAPVVKSSKGGNKTLAIAALGVGGAGLILGGVTGAMALGKHGDLSDKCPDGKCASDLGSDVDSYKTMGLLSTVGFIVGAVGIGAGAVLWFTSPKEGSATASGGARVAKGGFTWQPFVTAGGGGVSGRF